MSKKDKVEKIAKMMREHTDRYGFPTEKNNNNKKATPSKKK